MGQAYYVGSRGEYRCERESEIMKVDTVRNKGRFQQRVDKDLEG